jgi:hypothetical protein
MDQGLDGCGPMLRGESMFLANSLELRALNEILNLWFDLSLQDSNFKRFVQVGRGTSLPWLGSYL